MRDDGSAQGQAQVQSAVHQRILGRTAHSTDAVKILSFLAHNPDGWFASEAIQAHVSARVHPFTRFLDELVDDGFLRRRQVGGLILYSLTGHPEARGVGLCLRERVALSDERKQ